MRRTLAARLLGVEDSRCDPADPLRIGDHIDLDDLVLGHDEGHHTVGPAVDRDDDACRSVDQCRMELCRWVGSEAGLPYDSGRPVDDSGLRRTAGTVIRPEHDVGVKKGEQSVEVAAAGRGEERVDYGALTSGIRIG